MRLPSCYVLAGCLGICVIVYGLAFVLRGTGYGYALQLPLVIAAGAVTLAWSWYITRRVAVRRGTGVRALAALVVAAAVAGLGFVFLYTAGYVGVVVLLAIFAYPLFIQPNEVPQAS